MEFKYYSVNEINEFLQSNGLSVNKRFGQNFLINAGVADSIVKKAELSEDDLVFEIGCGLGSLTNRILLENPTTYGFEIDKAYILHINKLFNENKKFQLIAGDFLKTFDGLKTKIDRNAYRKTVFLGNLPYYITTPILEKIFTSGFGFDLIIIMLQKEVAERIISGPGTKKYGSLSVYCQFYSDPKVIINVSPSSFYPRPSVDSSVIMFKKKDNIYNVKNIDLFFRFSNSIFMNRRKQLKNNILFAVKLNDIEKQLILDSLEKLSIPTSIRGEELSVERIAEIVNNIES